MCVKKFEPKKIIPIRELVIWHSKTISDTYNLIPYWNITFKNLLSIYFLLILNMFIFLFVIYVLLSKIMYCLFNHIVQSPIIQANVGNQFCYLYIYFFVSYFMIICCYLILLYIVEFYIRQFDRIFITVFVLF